MRNNGFTLVELLAVIVILAIVLAIAIPGISNITNNATMSALESDAKMILKQLEYKKLEDSNFDVTTINTSNITNLNLSNNNYEYLQVGMNGENPYILIRGKNKWNGLVACGTTRNVLVYKVDNNNYCESIFNYTGSVQAYTVPQTGTYLIELWGAQGGSFDAYLGAKGAYVSGQIGLAKDTQLFLYIGSLGATVCNPYTSCPNPVFNGGGGGYYGGGGGYGGIATSTSSGSVGPGGGGSSFISGYTGCNAIDVNGVHTGQPNHYSGYIFTNGVMIAGNASMPSPSGNAETGHSGNGYARITYIGVR